MATDALNAPIEGLRSRVQETSKWLVTTFGAFGGFLLAGVQAAVLVTTIRGDLPVALALIGFIVSIGCVSAIIMAFGRVIVAPPSNLAEALKANPDDSVQFAPFNDLRGLYDDFRAQVDTYERLKTTDPNGAQVAKAHAESHRLRLRQYLANRGEEQALNAFNNALGNLPRLLTGVVLGLILFSVGLILTKDLERAEVRAEALKARQAASTNLIVNPVLATLTLAAAPKSDDGKALQACLPTGTRTLRVVLNAATITENRAQDPNGYTSSVTPLTDQPGCVPKVYQVPSTDAQILLR